MTNDCTPLFLHYRDTCRLIWNYGILCSPDVSAWDCIPRFREACARLYEAIVLSTLGFPENRVDFEQPGKAERLIIRPKSSRVIMEVDQNRPGANFWGGPGHELPCEHSTLRFVRFFDWDVEGLRDFHYFEVE